MESSPNIECFSLKADVVFLELSLFPRINCYGWEYLYLKVFLDFDAPEEPSWASSDSSTSGRASEAGSTSGPLVFEVLIASKHPAYDQLLAYEYPTYELLGPYVSSDTHISENIWTSCDILPSGYFSSNWMGIESLTILVLELYTTYAL